MRACLAAMTLWSGTASAQESEAQGVSGRVLCLSRSLTLCQDGFCFVSFDEASDKTFTIQLDLDRKTYLVPDLGTDAKPMRVVGTEHADGHEAIMFGIELAHGRSANVQLIANARNDGSLAMSAASRAEYPAEGTRSAIVAITALSCSKSDR